MRLGERFARLGCVFGCAGAIGVWVIVIVLICSLVWRGLWAPSCEVDEDSIPMPSSVAANVLLLHIAARPTLLPVPTSERRTMDTTHTHETIRSTQNITKGETTAIVSALTGTQRAAVWALLGGYATYARQGHGAIDVANVPAFIRSVYPGLVPLLLAD